jgi:hypothetical protein
VGEKCRRAKIVHGRSGKVTLDRNRAPPIPARPAVLEPMAEVPTLATVERSSEADMMASVFGLTLVYSEVVNWSKQRR